MYKLSESNTTDSRLLTISDACAYTRRGQTSLKRWLKEIGAERRFGKAVRYDKKVIDEALDKISG